MKPIPSGPARPQTAGLLLALALGAAGLAGCTTTLDNAPPPASSSSFSTAAKLDAAVSATLQRLYTVAPGSREMVQHAAGVLVFPEVIGGALIVGAEHGLFGPQQTVGGVAQFERRAPLALRPLLAGRLAPEQCRVPTDHAGAGAEPDRDALTRVGVLEHDVLERQPVELRAVVHGEGDVLCAETALRLVPLRGAGCRQYRVRSGTDVDVDRQHVAARDAARRMHDDGVTDARPLRMQRLLDDQRPLVSPCGEHRAGVMSREAERQLGVPAGGHGSGVW